MAEEQLRLGQSCKPDLPLLPAKVPQHGRRGTAAAEGRWRGLGGRRSLQMLCDCGRSTSAAKSDLRPTHCALRFLGRRWVTAQVTHQSRCSTSAAKADNRLLNDLHKVLQLR